MRLSSCVAVVAVAVALAAPIREVVAAPVYHVSPTGRDSNPGSQALPWKTIGRAAATLRPGETLLVGAGTYRERVVVEVSGEPGKPITFAARPGEKPVIDGTGIEVEKDEGLFEIRGSHIRLSGFHITGSAQAGILADNASDLVIEANHTQGTGSSGIGVWGCADVVVDGNEVALSCSGIWQEAISIAGTAGFEVRRNLVYNGPPGYRKEGITAKDGSSGGRIWGNEVHHVRGVGIYVDAWDKHTFAIEVSANNVHDVWEGSGIALASEMGGLLEGVSIRNNLAWNNRYCGIVVSRNGDSALHPMAEIAILNNTVVANGTEEWGGGILLDNPDARTVTVRNNACSRNLTFDIAVAFPSPALVIDHNLVHGSHDDPAETPGAAAVQGDPMFVDPKAGDFRLRQGSPAIDAGTPAGAPPDDYAGAARPRGKGVDIGAFER